MMAKVPRKDPESGAQLTDEELVVEYRTDGDREVFALLVRRYERELYSYLRRYLGSAEMAEDVFQATFLQVHLKCDRFDENRRFRPWLYTVATNQAIDAQRRNKRHRMVSLDRPVSADNVDIGALVDLLEGDERDPLENVSQLERGQWVQEALDGLSESMRSVIHLVYYQGMKYREAAEILDIPVGTVKSRLHAAIIKLYDSWDSPEV
jgi:RNA polymerase sigma-70 factor (ECF subfamily)